jgi:hypothetical protein
LTDRARGTAVALDATAARLAALGLSPGEAKPIRMTRQTLDSTARSLSRNRTRPLDVRELQTLISRLNGIRAARPASAVFPTLDPTPIDQIPRSANKPVVSRLAR